MSDILDRINQGHQRTTDDVWVWVDMADLATTLGIGF